MFKSFQRLSRFRPFIAYRDVLDIHMVPSSPLHWHSSMSLPMAMQGSATWLEDPQKTLVFLFWEFGPREFGRDQTVDGAEHSFCQLPHRSAQDTYGLFRDSPRPRSYSDINISLMEYLVNGGFQPSMRICPLAQASWFSSRHAKTSIANMGIENDFLLFGSG